MFGFMKHLSARVKILLIGFILILLPVAIISFMSFKSLNQKAENLEVKYDGTLRLVRDKLETEVLQFETDLRNDILELLSKPKNVQELKDWLQKAQEASPIFKQLVLVNQNKGLISSRLSLNWFDYKAPLALSNAQAEKYYQQAESAEFKT